KSLKKSNKIIAFALFEYFSFKSIKEILNDFLRKRIIHYFSIQINTNEVDRKILILNFKDFEKENIIKSFNIVHQSLKDASLKVKFLKNNILEKKFLTIFSEELNSRFFILNKATSIVLKRPNSSKIFNFININLNSIEKKKSFITNFVNLINNIGKEGFLIFHFKLDYNEDIAFSPYMIIESNNDEDIYKIVQMVNNFFKCQVLVRYKLKNDFISNFFWRLGITDKWFVFQEYQDLFSFEKKSPLLILSEMNETFEKNLIKNQIEYIRLSKNLIFIEQSHVFLTLPKLDSNYIHRVIEKYHPKYMIYILILDEKDYIKLSSIKSISLIENVKVINPFEIQTINYADFK
ncbi:MAG: hypothetical protein ACFFEY_19410, partial [Candidatus Thorarchaeota archaeon]